MIDWILKNKASTIVYIFYSPWILFVFFPFTPFYGDISKILIPVFLIFWIQMILYYVFTTFIGKRLIILDNNRYTNASLTGFAIHSIINLLLFTIAISTVVFGQIQINFPCVSMILAFLISELLRSVTITNLIVNLENQKRARINNKIATYYLVINPLLGLWNLHSRLRRIIMDK